MKHQQSCTPNTGNGGNLYSFGAASAGRRMLSLHAINSVCPRGWRIQQLSGNPSFANLFAYYKIQTGASTPASVETAIRNNPISLIRGGRFTGEFVRDNSGSYWTDTKQDNNDGYSYTVYFYSGRNNIVTREDRYGIALRCVAR